MKSLQRKKVFGFRIYHVFRSFSTFQFFTQKKFVCCLFLTKCTEKMCQHCIPIWLKLSLKLLITPLSVHLSTAADVQFKSIILCKKEIFFFKLDLEISLEKWCDILNCVIFFPFISFVLLKNFYSLKEQRKNYKLLN